MNRLLFITLLLTHFFLYGQTILERGDVAIVGVNASNGLCRYSFDDGNDYNGDFISFVFFKDILPETEFIVTDNGWEREHDGLWGNGEGAINFKYIGSQVIPKGKVLKFFLPQSGTNYLCLSSPYLQWEFTNLGVASLNFHNDGDQVYFLNNGTWYNGAIGPSGRNKATFNGDVLYGFTTSNWCTTNCNSSTKSKLHPQVQPCNYMQPLQFSDFNLYKGVLTPTTHLAWIARIKNSANWRRYTTCSAYNANDSLQFINIVDDLELLSILPNSICAGQEATLYFNLPETGYTYDVVYSISNSDGTNTFSLEDISYNHNISLTPNATTTYTLVSVVIHGDDCPIFPELENTEVTINITIPINLAFSDASVCQFGSYEFPSTQGLSGVWNPAEIDTNLPGIQTYTFTPEDSCHTGDSFELNVVPEPSRSFLASQGIILREEYKICRGDALSLPLGELQILLANYDIILTSPSGLVIDLTSEYTDAGQLVNLLLQLQAFAENGTWDVQVIHENENPSLPYNNSGCSWLGTLILSVLENPYAGEDGTLNICFDQQITTNLLFSTLGDDTDGNSPEPGGEWTTNDSNVTINSDGTITIPSAGTFHFTYTVEPEEQLERFLTTPCPEPDSAEVTLIISSLNINDTITNTDCEASNGSISLVINGATDNNNLSFSWQNDNVEFSTQQNITGLTAGNYTVVVSDSESNCSLTETFTVGQETTSITYNDNSLTTEFCVGDENFILPNDFMDSNAGSIPGSWHSGSVEGTITTFFDASLAGTFNYYFVPNAGCYNPPFHRVEVTVHQRTIPSFATIPTQCEGESNPLQTTSINGISGNWSPIFNPHATTTYTFTPYAGQCATITNLTVSISAAPNAGNSTTVTFCDNTPLTRAAALTLLGLPTNSTGSFTINGTPVSFPYYHSEAFVTMTYTVGSNGACPEESSTIEISWQAPVNAGSGGSITLCEGISPTIAQLNQGNGGNADLDGVWTQTSTNPEIWTYTVTQIGDCTGTDTSEVTIIRTSPPNAGNDLTQTFCEGQILSESEAQTLIGPHDVGGNWNVNFPYIVNNTNPIIYRVNATSPCTGNDTATITVSLQSPPYAGENGTLSLCADESIDYNDLFNALGGSPQTGGNWTNVGNVYTYTVEASPPCLSSDSATVTVSYSTAPNAGENGTLTICVGSTPTETQLFNALEGNPQTGGSWSQAGNVWTYTVTGIPPCGNNTATVTITYQALITPTFNLPINRCYLSSPIPLPTTSNNGIQGEWFWLTTGQYIPITEIATDVTGVLNLVFIPNDSYACVNNYNHNIDIRDGGGLTLLNSSGNPVPENIVVAGDSGNRIEADPTGGTFSNSDNSLLTINSSTGAITINNNGLIGITTITYIGRNGCPSKIEITVVSPNLPGGVILPSIWLKSDEINFTETNVTRPSLRVAKWKNAMSTRTIDQNNFTKRPYYIQTDEIPFNYHRYIKFNKSEQQVLYRESNLDYINPLTATFFNVSTAKDDLNSTIMAYRYQWNASFIYRPRKNIQTQSSYYNSVDSIFYKQLNTIDMSTGAEGHTYYNENVARIFGSRSNASQLMGFKNEYKGPPRTFINENPLYLSSNFSVGAKDINNEYSNDAVAEIIGYSRNLTDLELQKVRSYLAIKYGISFKLTPGSTDDDYVNSQGNLIYNPASHVGYHHNITIVGRDNTGINTNAAAANKDLYQKQSKSVNINGLLSLYIDGSIVDNAKFNSENPISTTFPNRTFFVIADNDESLSMSCRENRFYRIDRVWEMNKVGPGNPSKVSVGFNPADLPSEVSKLLVSQDPTFPLETTSIQDLTSYPGPGGTKKGYIFDNSNTEIENIPNGKYFTFGDATTPTFNFDLDYCKGEITTTLPTTSDNLITGIWSPHASIDTSMAGTFNYTFTPADGSCALPVSFEINITQEVYTFANLIQEHCTFDTYNLPLPTNGITGHWEDADGNLMNNNILTSNNEGNITLTFVPDPNQGGCYAPQDFIFNFINCACPEIAINITETDDICAGESIELTATITGNVTFNSWSTSGDGNFSNPNSLITTYTPGITDIANGTAIVTATTHDPDPSNPNCEHAFDIEVITISLIATAIFDQIEFNICENSGFILPTPNNEIIGSWMPATYSGSGNYVFTPSSACHVTTTITVNETDAPMVDAQLNRTVCGSAILPELTNGNYYTESGGTGELIPAGTLISSTQTIYIYAETQGSPNCFAETSFTITVKPLPEIDEFQDVSQCLNYTLPPLTHGNYFTQSGGGGTPLNEGVVITSSQLIFIYAESGGSPNCVSETSFFVEVKGVLSVVFNAYSNSTVCTIDQLPSIEDLQQEDDNDVQGSWSVTNVGADYSYTFNPIDTDCYDPFSFTITVSGSTNTVFAAYQDNSYCGIEQLPMLEDLPDLDDNNISGNWSVVNNGNMYTYTFTPTDAECYEDYTFDIILDERMTLNLPDLYDTTYCEGDPIEFPILTDNGNNPVAGTWTPSAINNTLSAQYVFTPEGCFENFTLNINITPKPITSSIQPNP